MHNAVLTRAGIAAAGTALLVGGLTACGGDKAGEGAAQAEGAGPRTRRRIPPWRR